MMFCLEEKKIFQSKSKKNIFHTNQKMGEVVVVPKDRNGLVLLTRLAVVPKWESYENARKNFVDRKNRN